MPDDKKQHVDFHRKILLRRSLLKFALAGPVYVPFCGDGDIAEKLYKDRELWIADNDPVRIAIATKRLNPAGQTTSDCNQFPFDPQEAPEFALADLDAWANPYPAYVSFLARARLMKTVVVFGTCAQKHNIRQHKRAISLPECKHISEKDWRYQANSWWLRHVLPFLKQAAGKERKIVRSMHYLRRDMLYWGVVLQLATQENKREPVRKFNDLKRREFLRLIKSGLTITAASGAIGITSEAIWHYRQKHPEYETALREAETQRDMVMVSDAETGLHEAAKSGNVVACQVILYNRAPERWRDKRHTELTGANDGPILTKEENPFKGVSIERLREIAMMDRDVEETKRSHNGS